MHVAITTFFDRKKTPIEDKMKRLDSKKGTHPYFGDLYYFYAYIYKDTDVLSDVNAL